MDRDTYSSASATSDSAIKIGVKKLPCSHLIKGVGSPIAHSCPLLSACGRAGGRPAHRIASHRIVHPLRYICAIDRPRTTPPKCKRGAFCLPGSHFARRNACPVCFTISFPALRGLEAPIPAHKLTAVVTGASWNEDTEPAPHHRHHRLRVWRSGEQTRSTMLDLGGLSRTGRPIERGQDPHRLRLLQLTAT